VVNFKGYVVYTSDNDRSENLIGSLRHLNLEYRKVESLSSRIDQKALEKLHKGSQVYELTVGRDLILGEIGGSYGHQRALASFLLDRGDWALVLEDDAILLDDEFDLYSILRTVPENKPVHINLGDPMRVIKKFDFRSNSELIKLHMPSLLAHAYLINRQAAQIYFGNFIRYGITSVPDWPYPQPFGVQFFLTKNVYFSQKPLSESQFSLTSERSLTKLNSSSQALSMPLSLRLLLKRIKLLRIRGFTLRDIIFHELVLRMRVRRSIVLANVSKKLALVLTLFRDWLTFVGK